MRTGVRSFQLNGTPVAIGVVNRLDSVMMILCGSPLAPFTSRKPSAPAPPPLFTTTMFCFMRLCLAMIDCVRRAIWSAPPPVPAGTMNSTVLVGSQAKAGVSAENAVATTAASRDFAVVRWFMGVVSSWGVVEVTAWRDSIPRGADRINCRGCSPAWAALVAAGPF